MLKNGGSYGIYASWFLKQLDLYPKRLHTLVKNNPLFDYLDSGETGSIEKTEFTEMPEKKTILFAPGSNFSEKALEILESSLQNPHTGPELVEEFIPLLFPEKEAVTPGDVINTIRGMIRRYHG
jgi:hypothetical protein